MSVTMTWLLRRYIFVIDYTANDSSFTYDTEKIRRKNLFADVHVHRYIFCIADHMPWIDVHVGVQIKF